MTKNSRSATVQVSAHHLNAAHRVRRTPIHGWAPLIALLGSCSLVYEEPRQVGGVDGGTGAQGPARADPNSLPGAVDGGGPDSTNASPPPIDACETLSPSVVDFDLENLPDGWYPTVSHESIHVGWQNSLATFASQPIPTVVRTAGLHDATFHSAPGSTLTVNLTALDLKPGSEFTVAASHHPDHKFVIDSELLFAQIGTVTQKNVAFDAVAHAWLRLHFAADAVVFETSSDGEVWQELFSSPGSTPPEFQVDLGLMSGGGSDGSAAIDSVAVQAGCVEPSL